MNKQEVLSKYKKEEDKLLIAKIIDKQVESDIKGKTTHTDFLDMAQQKLANSFIQKQKIDNCKWQGGYLEAQRKKLYFYPKKGVKQDEIEIGVLRVKLPKDKIGKYEHRIYLGGLLKLGIKREKIGDILVLEDGADILVEKEILSFLVTHLNDLVRFQKVSCQEEELKNIKIPMQRKEERKIIVSSMRLDTVISAIIGCSKSKAEEYLKEERVVLNYETTNKGIKEVKENSVLTIHGKGKYDIIEIEGFSKKQKIILKIAKWV